MNTTLGNALGIAELAMQLGCVERATCHPDGDRRETDTTHTVMLSLLVMEVWHAGLYRQTFDIDVGECLRFALVHDLVEAWAGDTVSIGLTPEARKAKADREVEALAKIERTFGARHWIPLSIRMYARQDTREARFVHFLDKVMPKLTHALNGGVTLERLGLDVEAAHAQHVKQLRYLAEGSPDLGMCADLFHDAHVHAVEAYRARLDNQAAAAEGGGA